MGNTTKETSIFRQAIIVNKKPFPWLKAFLAGIASGFPILVGLLFGSLEYGLIAGLGGFTYLYVFPIPYALLAKKLFWAVLGIATSVFLGTILAPYPIVSAIVMGLIGAVAIFIFGAFRLIGPSAIFFVLIFAMTTGMPVAPEEALLRAGLAFLGGAFSWIIAMAGWLFNPFGPEKNALKRSYAGLTNYIDTIGTEKEKDAQHQVMAMLKETSHTLASGYMPWRANELYNRLYKLNDLVNRIYLITVEQFSDRGSTMPKELGQSLNNVAQLIDTNGKNPSTIYLTYPKMMDDKIALLFKELTRFKDGLSETNTSIKEDLQFSTPSTKRVLLGTFDKNSIIFIHALRFGAFTMIAAIIAYELEFNRSFWVPLSCVAVMSGATAVATFHRAIQRSFGTIFGILIASFILVFHPSGYIIPLLIFLLTFITELFIVKNYGLAALFFTPSALIMAEAGSSGGYTFSYFASARLIDVFIGVTIGLIGVATIGRKSASSRIPHLISKTIRSQAQVIYVLFSGQAVYQNYGKNIEFNKMETNLMNLKTVYDTATGEIPKNMKAIEYYWPLIHSLEELGFLLDKVSRSQERSKLSNENLAQLLLVFEAMANAAERETSSPSITIPEMDGAQRIREVIEGLQKNLSIVVTKE